MMKQNNSSRTSSTNATETVADIVSKSEALMRGKTQARTHELGGETKG